MNALRRLGVVATFSVVVVAVGWLVVGMFSPREDIVRDTDVEAIADHDFVIPAGTAARIAAGEEVVIVPRRLDVRVGESIRIRNLDDEPHQVGPYYLSPSQTVAQTFTRPGRLVGVCTIHPDDEFAIVIS